MVNSFNAPPSTDAKPSETLWSGQDDPVALAQARAQIDAIDLQIMQLLDERAQATQAVRKAKAPESGLAYRPAREAQMIEKIFQERPQHQQPIVAYAVLREIVSASIMAQTPFQIALSIPKSVSKRMALRQVSRLHFGVGPEIQEIAPTDSILAAMNNGRVVAGQKHILGIVPCFDTVGEETQQGSSTGLTPWWAEIALASVHHESEYPVRVVAKLPLIPLENMPSAYVMAASMLQPSGKDVTLIAVQCAENISEDTAALNTAITRIKPECLHGFSVLAVHANMVLLAIEGFHVHENSSAPCVEFQSKIVDIFSEYLVKDCILIGVYPKMLG